VHFLPKQPRKRSFTLIELMIVIAILGLLAAIAVPAYLDYIVRSKVANMISAAAELKNSVSEYRTVNGDFDGIVPADPFLTMSNLGSSDPTFLSDSINSIEFAVGDDDHVAIVICGSSDELGTEPDETVNIIFAGTYLTAETAVGDNSENAGGMSWDCQYEGLPKYVPSSCRVPYEEEVFGTPGNDCEN
jgi:prepilin-type N-terminal cleavage/methylation domain-containing protein